MSLKKILLFPVSLMLSAAGCAGIGPNATYNIAATSFNYDPSYTSYMVKLNGSEIGGGFGGGTNTASVKIGPQIVTWGETNSKKKHVAKNQVILTKEQLKGKKYLAVHIYPDDTVEISTSNDWPNPIKKGLDWRTDIWEKNHKN
ncbi:MULTISPECIES: hypothetical protein [Acinetobacter]|jgi:hypothetical protein|uniref:hypothetical protein n=1 Tax=Acinetobacter TaxID=469 RepID=UPI0002BBF67F|nr:MULTISPECIES: hypothetical protein [Acinetobacter calcoaceticus/baumannii complex]EHU2136316.1 hypothetical protein [Acinetobacter baumannii]EIY0853667.1 hypothetical protein [Acinetobacter baumannii]EXC24206.1 hypothetical protein J536_3875 [Acinetobacter sp. 809848]EXE24454.1 hypothetical protein J569_3658 [Acinetobacter sp. 907131]EXS16536.1 hypothetical protein J672_1786 [Acinetobacter sp. 883425]